MTVHHKALTEEIGFVVAAKDYLLLLEGLPSVRVNDVLENDEGNRALVLALDEDRVQALLLDIAEVYAGDRFFVREHGIQLSLGEHLFGRVINAVGDSLDEGSGFPRGNTTLQFEVKAPGIHTRADITEQLKTGVTLVDTLVPIGRGQRQLVVGPFGSGKELFLQDAVVHQRDTGVVAIYALIGKPLIYVEEVLHRLFSEEGNKNAIALVTLSDEPAPMIFVALSSALTIAEHFSAQGKDVLVVLDDLGSHARYLREIELLAGRIPGRESYPGDVFYQHAHVMERAGRFNKRAGGGSITLLPVLETDIEEMSDLIATNIMAATDGHIFFSSGSHAEGYYPAVDPGRSVTRVGRKTQNKLQTALSTRIQTLLAEYEQQKTFSRFGAQVSEGARLTLSRGRMANLMLSQKTLAPAPTESQIMRLALVFTKYLADKDANELEQSKDALTELLDTHRALESLRASAARGVMSLNQFVRELDGHADLFESVWQR